MVPVNGINHSNMLEASFDPERQVSGGAQIVDLPLNLIAQVVSWIEDPGDLARVCRTCRLLHYMALPHLYRNISLTSYDRIRYRDEHPEGWGNASPFSMGLNTLVTRGHASLVQSMTLRGEWSEPELEEHSRVGRVPDSSMMLNISVRAALDRTKNIESFSWELNTKLLETVYSGLMQLPKLTSLSIRFPSSRHPRPICAIPAMPHLRRLKVTHIDPLCYPDDISTLLARSRRIEELTMHWSPRMRELQEPSVTFHDYFRHCVKEKSPMKLKKMAFYNLYARNSNEWEDAVVESEIEEMTFLSNLNGPDRSRTLTFVDQTWEGMRSNPGDRPKLKALRLDSITRGSCDFIASCTGLEKLYFVNFTISSGLRQNMQQQSGDTPLNVAGTPSHQITNGVGPSPAAAAAAITGTVPSSPQSLAPNTAQSFQLRDTVFNSILTNHRATLRHLILPSRWPLSTSGLARLVHSCPNLEQLAMAPEMSTVRAFGLLLPFLRKLKVVRIMFPPPPSSQAPVQPHEGSSVPLLSSVSELVELDDDLHAEKLSAVTADRVLASELKIIGIGWKAWELGDFYYVPASAPGSDSHRAAEDARLVTNASPSSQESPSANNPVSNQQSRARPQHQHNIYSTNTTPTSSLGKRARDEASPPPESSNKPTLLVEADNVYDTLPSGETIIWKRRIRPVKWETVKNWEIFALDSQDCF